MADERWLELRRLLSDLSDGFAGKIEYGNLRVQVYDGAADDGESGGRIAFAYETPGGSTNQFDITFHDNAFHMLDASADAVLALSTPEEVVERVDHHLREIPGRRLKVLRRDIDQMVGDGSTRRQMLEELNRMMRLQTEFRGGSLTIDELTEACRYIHQVTQSKEA